MIKICCLGSFPALQTESELFESFQNYLNHLDKGMGEQYALCRPAGLISISPLEIHCCCLVPKSFVQFFCGPMGCSPPGSSVPGISQARILEWVAISFLRGSSQPGDGTRISSSPALAGGFFTTGLPGKHTYVLGGEQVIF